MAVSKFEHVRITGIKAVVPENVISIDDELQFFKNDLALLQRNKKILGLQYRHVVDDRTTNCDLCEQASVELLDSLNIDRSTIDCLIVVSSSHDYHYPASSCILQGRLGLPEECLCFDIGGLACSAYVHGLQLAHSLIENKSVKRCLLLAGDLTSLHSDRRNRNSNMLFGDAGTATLLEYAENSASFFYLGTRGKDWDKLIAPAGGYALPVKEDIASLEVKDETGNVWRLTDDIMKGLAVFKFTTEIGPKGIKKILEISNKSIESLDYVAFHQANKQIVQCVAKLASVPVDKYSYETFSLYGNCGAASVILDLCRELSHNNHKNVCLATFGVGLSWGFCLLDMSNTRSLGISIYKNKTNKPGRKEQIKRWIEYFKNGKVT